MPIKLETAAYTLKWNVFICEWCVYVTAVYVFVYVCGVCVVRGDRIVFE